MDTLVIEVHGVKVPAQIRVILRDIFVEGGITYGTIAIDALKCEKAHASVMWHADGVRPIGCSALRAYFLKKSAAGKFAKRFVTKWKRFYGQTPDLAG